LRDGVGNVLLDLLDRPCVDQRTQVHAGVEAISDGELADCGLQLGRERVIDARLHIEAVGADAGLAIVTELGNECPLDCGVEVGIVQDNEGCVAAQFKAEFLDGGRALRHQLGADLRLASEGLACARSGWTSSRPRSRRRNP
jgi:hypothetical protein